MQPSLCCMPCSAASTERLLAAAHALTAFLAQWSDAAGCYELYAMLYGEQRSFWHECALCLSDAGSHASQRLLSFSKGSYSASTLQRVRSTPVTGEGSSMCQGVQDGSFPDHLAAERWKSADLDMMQQLSETGLFGVAA